MILLPSVIRRASLYFLLAAVRLGAQNTTSLTSPDKVTPDLSSSSRTTSAPVNPASQPELKLVSLFDLNRDHRLDPSERVAARAYLAQHPVITPAPVPGRPAPVPLPTVELESMKIGRSLSPDQVETLTDGNLFGTRKIRTLFLTFAEPDWETELADFARTDVQVPARLEVDGKILDGVGVHFRPTTEPATRAAGYKRTLRLILDYTVAGQQLVGRHQLELHDAASDPTFLRTLLYHQICQNYLAAPVDSLVRVVINGENWGIYNNTEPFDEVFIQRKYGAKAAGARWTAGPRANLAYLGDDPAAYRSLYRLDSPEDPAAWTKLIQLCKILQQTPVDDLGPALAPLLDIDSTLRFFALENAFINLDGYGSPTGSYGIYLGRDGRFRLIPRDAEHSFRLVQVAEYAKGVSRPGSGTRTGSSGEGRRKGNREKPTVKGKATASNDAKEAALLSPYLKKDFPKQSGTDLAMMLSYSFISKADRNQDEKVTAEEWHAFATSWFVVMDEDVAGRITRDQFIAKVRQVVTPPSVLDGRTTQTFGHDDAAAEIGADFLKVMDADHDGYVTRDEMVAAFDHWYDEWTESKTAGLTQPSLQRGFTELFSQSVFVADQAFIPKSKTRPVGVETPSEHGRGGRGGRGGQGGGGEGGGDGESGGGSGLSLGPIHLGLPKLGGREEATRSLVTFGEQLDPLEGKDEAGKPLLAKMLAVSQWRSRYLAYLNDLANDWLLWSRLGPIAKEYHEAIAAEVKQDTHKPFSYERFVQELDQDTTETTTGLTEAQSLKSFLTARRSYLLRNETDRANTGD